jgi:hypothetical protein
MGLQDVALRPVLTGRGQIGMRALRQRGEMSLRVAAVMALGMTLAVVVATVTGLRVCRRMMGIAESFGVYIRGHHDIAQHEQQGQEEGGNSVHGAAILLKNRMPGKTRMPGIPLSSVWTNPHWLGRGPLPIPYNRS